MNTIDWSLVNYADIIRNIQNNLTVPTLNGLGEQNAFLVGVSDATLYLSGGDVSKLPQFQNPPISLSIAQKIDFYRLQQENLQIYFDSIATYLSALESKLGGYVAEQKVGETVRVIATTAVNYLSGGLVGQLFSIFEKVGVYFSDGSDPYGVLGQIKYCAYGLDYLGKLYNQYESTIIALQKETPANQITPNTNNTLYWIIGGILLLFILIYFLKRQ